MSVASVNPAGIHVLGLGFRSHSGVDSLRAAVDAARQLQDAPLHFTALATAEDKAHHPALLQLAEEMHLPIRAIALAQLPEQAATPSAHVPARYSHRSLAEAAALAGAGAGSHLLTHRVISPDHLATAAIATGTTTGTTNLNTLPSEGTHP